MKLLLQIVVALLLLVGSVLGLRHALFTNVHVAKALPTCIESYTHFYWVSWAGSYHDTGETDIEKARLVAGDHPLTKLEGCKTWSNN